MKLWSWANSRRAALIVAAVSVLWLIGCAPIPPETSSSTLTAPPGSDGARAPGTSSRGSRPPWPVLARDGDTYRVPDPLPPGGPGDLIAVSDEGPDAAVGGVDRRLVLYHSTNAAGSDIAVSGAVFVPTGPPPPGGWPVISWAHGTTGIADKCAPSATPNLFYNEYAQLVRLWTAHGYAVAATDYPGLGTPGTHSYLIGIEEGNAVVDNVTAARHLDSRLAPTWFAVGHSQGGQAVLFASRTAATRNPDLHLRATVAIAPASGLKLILPAVIGGLDTSDVAYALYALIGLSAVDADVHPAAILGPVGQHELPAVLNDACLDQTDPALTAATPDQTFHLTAQQVTQYSDELHRYGDPDTEPTNGPVLVVQGATDQDVPPPVTATAVNNLKALGSDIAEKLYPDLNHDQVIGPSSCDVLNWLADHGGPPTGTCTPQPTAP